MAKFIVVLCFFLASAAGMQLFFKGQDGKTITVDGLADSDNITAVKHKLAEKAGCQSGQIRILKAGAELYDSDILSDKGVQNDSTLHYVYRLPQAQRPGAKPLQGSRK